MQELLKILSKRKKLVVGLMSGTSVDGVDAALVEIEGSGLETSVRLVKFVTHPFPEHTKKRIFQLFPPSHASVEDICEMNFAIGRIFAEAALDVIDKAGLEAFEVDLVGSHGQTVCHLPNSRVRSTLQIGEPAVIAHVTGILTVADFRVADMAAGGQGAPLVPYVDFLIFRDTEKTRAIQNIGGIGNVTVLPAGCTADEVLAFDTGPGNMVIDEVMNIITKGERRYDAGGEMAASGTPDQTMLRKLLSHPFISRVPPKTSGREEFGKHFAQECVNQAKRLGLSDADLVATVTAYTAECIYENYRQFIMPRHDIDEILVSGGGLHNATMMKTLREKFDPVPVKDVGEYGLVSDAKEAIAFAVLANETIHGNPGNIPGATGAERRVILGKIAIPDR